MKKMGVIGAGTMGAGIAQVFLAAGWTVEMCDISTALAEKGLARIKAGLNKQVEKGKLDAGACEEMLARIGVSAGYEKLAGCELVVEAALEEMDVKKKLYEDVSKLVGAECILASNTSSLSITEIASAAQGSHRVIGMHFFNPAPVMKLIEVIEGAATAPEVKEKVVEISREIGKTPVLTVESPGFVVNRLLVPMINEAAGIFAEGVTSAEDIDTAMKLGCNHPIGPLALGDMVGLDIVLNVMQTLHREFGDDKYRAHPIIKKMVRAGHLGMKTKKGFYDY